MIRRAWVASLVVACAAPPTPDVVPAPTLPQVGTLPTTIVPDVTVEPLLSTDRREAALAAYRAGLMSLHATAIDRHRELAPRHDGRGVLIAILDSGIDPAVAGLDSTTDGKPKLLDLRDFSGEGRIPLAPATVRGDTIWVGPRRLQGATTVLQQAPGSVWGGLVPEVRFGREAAADLDGNGLSTDTLVVVVAGASDRWMLFVDRGGNGRLADDLPVRDYALHREWFAWSRAAVSPMAIAANLSDSAGVPLLSLVFDNSGHGTHVAGIAAGRSIHGVNGFDGVAPGAQVLGLKIATNADGGISTTGSMQRAIAHAIAVAESLHLPLVINLSFGVGNQDEGTAVIDALVDSMLQAHPAVLMTVAASNDGPGLSTLGFPASAAEVLAIGATQPLVFEGLAADPARFDPVALFSSRGGERAGPDLVAPGIAWSTVPQFDVGNEEKSGTSMAAPHVAGILARLVSGEVQERRTWTRARMHQALRATARAIPDATLLDQGAGVPDIVAAGRWLRSHRRVPALAVVDATDAAHTAVWVPIGVVPSTIQLRVHRTDSSDPIRIRVRSGAPWLRLDGSAVRTVGPSGATLHFTVDSAIRRTPGVLQTEVRIDDAADPSLGALRRVPVTVRIPVPDLPTQQLTRAIHAGGTARVAFRADTGRGIHLDVEAVAIDGAVLLALHEPGGQPARDVAAVAGGHGEAAGVIDVDARDAVRGGYEAVLQAPATSGVAARLRIAHAPIRLGATLRTTTLGVSATSLAAVPIEFRLRAALTGVEWQHIVASPRATDCELPIVVPTWAAELVVDVGMDERDWSRFTDFGVTLRRRDGRIVEEEPLNYAFGRLRLEIPPGLRGDTLMLTLTPAAAVSFPDTPWRVTVEARFLMPNPVAIDDGGRHFPEVEPGGTRELLVAVSRWPVELPAGWDPVVTVVAFDQDHQAWTRQVPLRASQGPSP